MACVYCDSYKLEKEHKCADGNISLILCKRSLENSADNELFRKKNKKKTCVLFHWKLSGMLINPLTMRYHNMSSPGNHGTKNKHFH